jgi:hypothetical protein
MEAVGTARSCEFIRWPTRLTHDAELASDCLIQIIQPNFVSRLRRSRIFPGRGSHRFDLLSDRARGNTHRSVAAAPTGDRGAIPKRYEEWRMSSLSEHEHDNLDPNDPTYYAPRWLRERSEPRLSPSSQDISEPVRSPIAPPASLDLQLENAVSDALWHPLDPEIIHEPPGLARELDRRDALISVAGRFTAAVGVSAIVALFFVFMVPASRQAEAGSTVAGIMKSIKSVLLLPGQRNDGSKAAVAEFQTILASAQTGRPATHEQSEHLLQQFLQWRQKPNPIETSQ